MSCVERTATMGHPTLDRIPLRWPASSQAGRASSPPFASRASQPCYTMLRFAPLRPDRLLQLQWPVCSPRQGAFTQPLVHPCSTPCRWPYRPAASCDPAHHPFSNRWFSQAVLLVTGTSTVLPGEFNNEGGCPIPLRDHSLESSPPTPPGFIYQDSVHLAGTCLIPH